MQRRTQSMKLGERGRGVGAESSPDVPVEEAPTPGLVRPSLLCTDPDDAKMDLLKGYIEGTSKDDMHLVLQKSPVAQRPLSLQEQDRFLYPEDPHAILTAYESTGDLDDMSDTASFASEMSSERMEDFEDRGLLGVPGGASGGSSREVSPAVSREVSPAVSVDVSPAMSRESSQASVDGMEVEAERKDREQRQETEGGGSESTEEEDDQMTPRNVPENTDMKVPADDDGDLTPVAADAKQIHLVLDSEGTAAAGIREGGNSEDDPNATPTRTRAGTLIAEAKEDVVHPRMEYTEEAQVLSLSSCDDTTEDTLTEETQTDEQELDEIKTEEGDDEDK